MKLRTAALFLITAALVLGANAQTPSAPANAGPSKVAMIDISRAVLSTTEGKRDLEALNKKYEPRQAEFQKQMTDLQEMGKQLDQDQKLTDEARSALLKNIEQKQLVLQHGVEDVQSDYRREQNEIVGRVLKKMAPIIDKYARDNGYTMIFDAQFWPAGPVLWASGPAADITGAVITAYNAQATSALPARGSSSNGTTPPK
jgi:outer membrane protein